MKPVDLGFPRESPGAIVRDEALSLVLGAAVTVLLFLGVVRFDSSEPARVDNGFSDLRIVSLPPEAAPPRQEETPPVPAAAVPFSGIEVAPSESALHITVVPPDLAALVPESARAPVARIEAARLYTDFKPRPELRGDLARVYQAAEVDQLPAVIYRPKPSVPSIVRSGVDSLRINLLIVIDANGAVTSVRILESSGNKYFDDIIVDDLQHSWVFSPAVKNSRKVRCMVRQSVRVEWNSDLLELR